MREILIVRHAKSSWKYPKLEDGERPLNKRGKRDAHEMGRRLGARGIRPDLILASATQRALATGLIIASQLGLNERLIRLDGRIYGGETQALLEMLREIPDGIRRPMLIGHHTGVPQLVSSLTGQTMDHMPTCALACVALDTAHWAGLRPGLGQLKFYDYPKRLQDS